MRWWRTILVVAGFCLGMLSGHAAFDAYLKIEGVTGESADAKHAGWIDVQSFNNGAAKATDTVPADFSSLCLIKLADKSSPVLSQKCAQGAVFPAAQLEFLTSDANRLRFYQITLSNLVVSSVSTSGQSGGSETPQESVCLNFRWISWTCTEFDVAGAPVRDISAWWNLALNTGADSQAPVLRVSGTQLDSGTLRLSWPGQAGKSYNILSSPVVTGTYRVIQTIPAPVDGPLSVSLPVTGGANFFRVQETP